MRFAHVAATALSLSIAIGMALPAKADLVIQGRAAQALHCSAILFMVSDELHSAGYISQSDRDWGQEAAVMMLEYVPGTEEQKVQAMSQRFEKLMRTRSLDGLMQEYNDTADWCQKNFL